MTDPDSLDDTDVADTVVLLANAGSSAGGRLIARLRDDAVTIATLREQVAGHAGRFAAQKDDVIRLVESFGTRPCDDAPGVVNGIVAAIRARLSPIQ
jgi:hypothetical protein